MEKLAPLIDHIFKRVSEKGTLMIDNRVKYVEKLGNS